MNPSRHLLLLAIALVSFGLPLSAADTSAADTDPFGAANSTQAGQTETAMAAQKAADEKLDAELKAAAAKPRPWSWVPTTTATDAASAPAQAAVIFPVGYADPCPADSLKVEIVAGDKGGTFFVKKGTAVLAAIEQMGGGQYLTDSAKILIESNAYVDLGDGHSAGWAEQSLVDVAAVRANQAKDVILQAIDAPTYKLTLTVAYDEFHFPGGTPQDFVKALEKHFGVDWSVAQIPPAMANESVPEFRSGGDAYDLYVEKPDGQRITTGQKTLCQVGGVVQLYNQIALKYPAIGTWAFSRGQNNDYSAVSIYRPDIVMLIPPDTKTGTAAPALKVKADPLANIPEFKWDTLQDNIANAMAVATEYGETNKTPAVVPEGHISIQRDSKILVIVGNQGYIDLVESVLAAYDKNAAIEKASQPKPPPGPNPGHNPPAST